MRRERGQSILEYMILFTTVLTAINWAADKYLKPAIERALSDSAETIKSASARLPR